MTAIDILKQKREHLRNECAVVGMQLAASERDIASDKKRLAELDATIADIDSAIEKMS